MDRLDMALALIEEARNEKKRLEAYNQEYDKAFELDLKSGYSWAERNKVNQKYRPIPTKATINDCIKMARRILAGEYVK